jgi:hypothetical protein
MTAGLPAMSHMLWADTTAAPQDAMCGSPRARILGHVAGGIGDHARVHGMAVARFVVRAAHHVTAEHVPRSAIPRSYWSRAGRRSIQMLREAGMHVQTGILVGRANALLSARRGPAPHDARLRSR